MYDYFSEGGLGYVLGRCPIDSCDFALGNYSAMNDPNDLNLNSFTLERDAKYIFPLLNDALKETPSIKLTLSPWSPPAFMKSNGEKNNGGFLLPQYRKLWADYLCRYITEYRKMGYEVFALSVQNEPNAKQSWDSCLYTAEEEQIFIRDYLIDSIVKSQCEDVNLIVWDHNKERIFDRTETICSDEITNNAVGGVGFHWYSGDHFEALELVRRKYPDKLLIFTEGCIEYSKFSSDSQLKNAQMYAHEIIGSMNAGMNAFLDWNLFLDFEGGPNHVNNLCDAPIMLSENGLDVRYNLSYDYIGHFSRYIKPGARRIGFSRYTHQLEVTAFENTDGKIVVVILNPTQQAHSFYLRYNGNLCPVDAPLESISTLILEAVY
jgi:glucosylceramidase